MKTDYISPGAAAMSRLRRTTASARQIQREQLQAILRQNAAAEYGTRYDFSHIRSLADFQRQVPLSCYQDYEPYIQALLSGSPPPADGGGAGLLRHHLRQHRHPQIRPRDGGRYGRPP